MFFRVLLGFVYAMTVKSRLAASGLDKYKEIKKRCSLEIVVTATKTEICIGLFHQVFTVTENI
jgi:heme/copper-type cytochrome/quinol oxidase subunit 2